MKRTNQKRRYLVWLLSLPLLFGLITGACLLREQSGSEENETIRDTVTVPKERSDTFLTDPEAIERAASSVVRLEVFDAKGDKIGTGSGFAVGDPAVLVTAAHVIHNMEYMIAWRDDGTSFRIGQALNADTDADIAICPLPEDAGLTPLPVAQKRTLRGEDILVIGSQFGLTNLVSKGTVCGMWNTDDADWTLFSAPVSAGCSGGPVFNKEGQVTGMVMGTYEKAQNLNLATPADKILKLLNK